MTSPLDRLVDALAEECPVCGTGPNQVTVLGPDAILLEPRGHDVDATEWLDAVSGPERSKAANPGRIPGGGVTVHG